MSNVQEVMDYIMNTPHNTNPMILKQKLEGLDNGGNSGGGKDKSLYGLPYRCNLMFAGEIQPKQDEYGECSVDQEVEFSDHIYLDDMFIVFIGEKINDNKYGIVVTHSYASYNYELEEQETHLNLDGNSNSLSMLGSADLKFIGTDQIKIQGSWENEKPFYLTVYKVVPREEEYQFDIQLEDFIDSSLLPIPTIFMQNENGDERSLKTTSRSYEQIEEQINMLKYQAVLIIEDGYRNPCLNSIGYINGAFRFLTLDSTSVYVNVSPDNMVWINDFLGE